MTIKSIEKYLSSNKTDKDFKELYNSYKTVIISVVNLFYYSGYNCIQREDIESAASVAFWKGVQNCDFKKIKKEKDFNNYIYSLMKYRIIDFIRLNVDSRWMYDRFKRVCNFIEEYIAERGKKPDWHKISNELDLTMLDISKSITDKDAGYYCNIFRLTDDYDNEGLNIDWLTFKDKNKQNSNYYNEMDYRIDMENIFKGNFTKMEQDYIDNVILGIEREVDWNNRKNYSLSAGAVTKMRIINKIKKYKRLMNEFQD